MRMTHVLDEIALVSFAQRAAKCFSEDKTKWTFTDGEIISGCMFAARWGLGNDCVLVFRLNDEEPVNFQNIVGDDLVQPGDA